MVLTENIRVLAKRTMFVISAHTVLLVVCCYIHEKIDLFYAITAFTPLLLLLCLIPLVAAFFLSTKSARQAAIVLLGVLPAELIYNIITRFTALPPITGYKPAFIWKILYEGSYGLVLVLEVIGSWLTLKLLQEIHKQINSPTKSSTE